MTLQDETRTMVNPDNYAPILTLEEFATLRDAKDLGVIVCTSGGYDPIHPGHISCIIESQSLGDTMVVVVNGEGFLRSKKGKAFQSLETRCKIVSGLRGVDYVVSFEIEGDMTVAPALRAIRPMIFTKGGDRQKGKSMPPVEEQACEEFGIELVDGVGFDKAWSSSDSLKEWGDFVLANQGDEAGA